MDSFFFHRFYSERIITYEASDKLTLCFKPKGFVMLLERSLTKTSTVLQYTERKHLLGTVIEHFKGYVFNNRYSAHVLTSKHIGYRPRSSLIHFKCLQAKLYNSFTERGKILILKISTTIDDFEIKYFTP